MYWQQLAARATDMAMILGGFGALVLAWKLITWKIRTEIAHRSHEIRRRIMAQQEYPPVVDIRRHVNHSFDKAA